MGNKIPPLTRAQLESKISRAEDKFAKAQVASLIVETKEDLESIRNAISHYCVRLEKLKSELAALPAEEKLYKFNLLQWREGTLQQYNGTKLRIWYGTINGEIRCKILEMPGGDFFAIDAFHDTLELAQDVCQKNHEEQLSKFLTPVN